VGQSLGGSRAVQARPSPAAAYATPVPYAKQHLHAKKIGISCGQLSAERDGATIVQNAIKSTGGTLTASQGGSVTGTSHAAGPVAQGSRALVGAPNPAQMG
jgi:hypothetical protein